MQSSWRRGIAAVALVVLAGSVGYPPALAHGNGRYPAGRFVVVGPGVHGALIALQATFGVVLSSDGGRTWRWLCEESLGFSGTFDPALAFTRGGTLGVGLPDGLSLSNRSQCSFSRPATAPRTQVIDLAVDPLGDTMLAAFTPLGGRNAIGISNDQGLTWRTTELPADVRIDTLDVVPGHPERIYVSGSHMGVPLLMRSDDGGGSFVETTRSFLGGFDAYITAVDGAQPDVVYVRTNLPSGATTLARSTDRGVTLRPLVQTSTLMVGATVAADGRRMWASSSRLSDGLLRSSDGGSTWENLPLSFLPLCLRHHAGILFACADQATYGFALACSTDGGEHFAPLLAFEDVAGPEACPAGSTVREQCDPRRSALRSMLRADSGVPSPPRMYHDADLGDPAELPDVPKDDALPHLDAGHDSGPLRDANSSDSAGRDARVLDTGPDAGTVPRRPGACGCQTPPRGSCRGTSGWALLALAMVRRRRSGGRHYRQRPATRR